MSVATMAPSSDGRTDVIRLSLLGATVAMARLTLAHSSLVSRNLHSIYSSKHILHSISERKHNLITHIYIYNTELIHLITYIYTEFIHLI
jgi:hypothetical protein